MLHSIYLSSVALEKNRWTMEKLPSITASQWLERALSDGFDGMELWENHYLLVERSEQKKLEALGHIGIYNTYAAFDQGLSDDLRRVAEATWVLRPAGIKFNLGKSDGNIQNRYSVDEIRYMVDTALSFIELLPPDVHLLSECHNGSAMQDPYTARILFEQLGQRVGAIIHLPASIEDLSDRVKYYGERICHIHTQYRPDPFAPWPEFPFLPLSAAEQDMRSALNQLNGYGFTGSASIEFCAGGADAESCYAGALADLHWLLPYKHEHHFCK